MASVARWSADAVVLEEIENCEGPNEPDDTASKAARVALAKSSCAVLGPRALLPPAVEPMFVMTLSCTALLAVGRCATKAGKMLQAPESASDDQSLVSPSLWRVGLDQATGTKISLTPAMGRRETTSHSMDDVYAPQRLAQGMPFVRT